MAGSCFERRSDARAAGRAEMPAMPPEVIVGVRPEHTRLWHDGSGLVGPIEGRAAYVEMLGRENFIGVESAGDTHFTVHAEPDSHVREGEPVRFGLERGRSTSSTRRRTRPSRGVTLAADQRDRRRASTPASDRRARGVCGRFRVRCRGVGRSLLRMPATSESTSRCRGQEGLNRALR